MRLAHLADPHLGFRQYHRLTARGHNQREADVALAFTRAIDGVIAEKPNIVVVAGDLFHAVRPTNAAILHAVREFSRLQRMLPNVPVVVIAGNHDTPRSSDTTSIFGLLNEIGVQVADQSARRFAFPDLDLALLAVPHQALFEEPRIAVEPSGRAKHQVLVIHGETPELFGADRSMAEPGGAMLTPAELRRPWSYVALGHYHVQCDVGNDQVGEHQWYAGALDYCSPNPWGELQVEAKAKRPGKGWLMFDSDTRKVKRHAIEAPRRFLDLRRLDAVDMTAVEVDRLIAASVDKVEGGIAGAVVRLVVTNVPRPVGRELDHARIRAWKADALHFQLDLRRPDAVDRQSVSGAPGIPETLPETLTSYLRARALPPGMDHTRFVSRGVELLESVEREATGGDG